MSSQTYIGSPNGVIVCLDRIAGRRITGRLYHRFSDKAIPFFSEEQAVFLMEELFDSLHFPHPGTIDRSFTETKKTASSVLQEKVMTDEELLSKHGDLGTFIIRVQHRQNSSWQGAVTWVESEQTVHFRSIWEMIKLVESAMDSTGAREHDRDRAPAWAVKENPT